MGPTCLRIADDFFTETALLEGLTGVGLGGTTTDESGLGCGFGDGCGTGEGCIRSGVGEAVGKGVRGEAAVA